MSYANMVRGLTPWGRKEWNDEDDEEIYEELLADMDIDSNSIH